jgi:hypothetical protein
LPKLVGVLIMRAPRRGVSAKQRRTSAKCAAFNEQANKA